MPLCPQAASVFITQSKTFIENEVVSLWVVGNFVSITLYSSCTTACWCEQMRFDCKISGFHSPHTIIYTHRNWTVHYTQQSSSHYINVVPTCTISSCTVVKYTCLTVSKRLRATGTSRLYQNGLPEKLKMEEEPAPVEVWHNVFRSCWHSQATNPLSGLQRLYSE